ncbi:MAG: sigma 54-interacting transcriptional regulator [Clostridium sp.]|nr:sigma 54-interacting transcriptional regulator [Clostridium sp.]
MRNEAEDGKAAEFIRGNLREVMDDRFEIVLLYRDDSPEEEYAAADLILVPVFSLLQDIRGIIHDDLDRILFASRTLSKYALEKVMAIPPGENVVVLNRHFDSTNDMLRLLYQLGVVHLNLTPYSDNLDWSQYSYVITTPNLSDRIPSGKQVVNVHYRKLDTQSFLDIFSKLNLEDEKLTSRLTRYIQTLPEKHTDVEQRYLSSQLLVKTLRTVFEASDFGTVVTDCDQKIIHCNQRANELFGTAFRRHDLFALPGEESGDSHLFKPEFTQDLLHIGDEYIMIQRYSLMSDSETIGYYFECRTASSISEMGSSLSQRLKKSGLYAKYRFSDIIAAAPKMKNCLDVAKKLAKTDYSILLSGESGAGKEMLAQSIHNASLRKNGPFVAVNCAAFPEALLESELFGYVEGAFTGSRKGGKSGLFELANKGSIFLDEIGDMPSALQVKLLRVLQEKKIMRVGGDRLIDVDIRVISASNKNLKEEVSKGSFRADLYYRLSTFTVDIPPLRERKEDIIPLFYSFSSRKGARLSDEGSRRLTTYDWPGNVRELQNVAAYYDVIGNLDVLAPPVFPAISADEEAEACVLAVLRRYPNLGLGRKRFMALLEAEGMHLSANRFEKIIRSMAEQGLITRGRGRGGIRIVTQKDPLGR